MKMLSLTLILCFIVGHVQNDLVSPSFPDMINFLGTTVPMFHLTSSAFSLGLGIGSFFLGPLSDSFGRKRVLFCGLMLLMLACLGCTSSVDVYSLICFRFIQGIGTAAPVVVCVAIVFDLYDKSKSRQIIGTKNAALTFAKSLAPIIGGYVNVFLSWQVNFLILSLMAIVVILLILSYLPKNSKLQTPPTQQIFKSYLFLLSKPTMLLYTCILGFMACVLITYTIAAPIVYINHLNVPKEAYGFHQGAVWVIFGIFSFLNHYLIRYIGKNNTKKLGLLLVMMGAILLNITAHLYIIPIFITLSIIVCAAGFALLITILFTEAMSLYSNLRGASSSFIALFRTFFVAITVAIAG